MDTATWRARAERELGRPIDRLDYCPLPEVRLPALSTTSPVSSRGAVDNAGWAVGATYCGVPEEIATQIQADLDHGLEAVRIDVRLMRGARDLANALAPCDPSVTPVELAHAGIGHAAALVALQEGLRRDLSTLKLDFALDPIGMLGRTGYLAGAVEDHIEAAADLARWTLENCPLGHTFVADGTLWHDAGADEAWSIALVIATAVAYLRAMEAADVPLERAFDQIQVRQALPGRFLLSTAKLRATRRITARIAELCQVQGTWRQSAQPAWRERTERAPTVNILRNTASTFAAIIGGAQRICVPAHVPTDEGRRLALNTQHMLRAECGLDRVTDPGGGSHVLENLTDQLAQRAWACFQEIEAEGGMVAALTSGFVAKQLAACVERASLHTRTRKAPILGVTRYPDLDEAPPLREMEEELPTAVPGGLPACNRFEDLLPHALASQSSELTHARVGRAFSRAPAVFRRRFAAPFEALRNRGDLQPTSVFIATVGPLSEHSARTAFGKELVEAGGLRALIDDSCTTVEDAVDRFGTSGTKLAVVSTLDKRFGDEGVRAVQALTEAGARVWMLGRAGEHDDALRSAGLQGYLGVGIDLYETLLNLWEQA